MANPKQPASSPARKVLGLEGWGPNGDQENPLVKLGRRVAGDARETVYDIKDEPQEVPYRIKERIKSYLPNSTRWNYRDGDYTDEPLTPPKLKSDGEPGTGFDYSQPMPRGRATMDYRPEDDVRSQVIAGRPFPRLGTFGPTPFAGQHVFDAMRSEGKTPPEARMTIGAQGVSNADPAIVSINALRAEGKAMPSPMVSLPPSSATPEATPPMASETIPINIPRGEVRYPTKLEAVRKSDPQSRGLADGEVEPPMRWGRGRGAGVGALGGLEANRGGSLGEKIGGLIAGTAIGGFKPNLSAAFQRDYDIKKEQGQEEERLALENQQAQVAYNQQRPVIAEAEAQRKIEHDAAQLEIERQRAAGVISEQEARRKERELDRLQKEADRVERERHNRETETISREMGSRVGAEHQDVRSQRAVENQANRVAKRRESEDALANAQIYDNNAIEADKVASNPDSTDDEAASALVQARQYRAEAATLRRQAASAKSEAESIPIPVNADPLKGAKWSKSKYRGNKPIEQAAQEAAARGAVIVD